LLGWCAVVMAFVWVALALAPRRARVRNP